MGWVNIDEIFSNNVFCFWLQMRVGYGRSVFERLLPIILGRDVSGEVAAVGASVKSVTVGQQVFGALHPTAVRGTYTDYAILSEEEVTSKPDSLSHVVCVLVLFLILYIVIINSDFRKKKCLN